MKDHPLILRAPFGRLPDGSEASLFTLGSDDGLRAAITDFGGAIVSLFTPDRRGEMADVVLGYDSVSGYLAGKSFFGGIVGRCGNRIARGRFEIDGVEFSLPINDGPNHLHGGPEGFDRVPWNAEIVTQDDGPALRLSRISPDGEQGYPGRLRVEVVYSLFGNDAFRIVYRAEAGAPTIVNLTNHSYFNLAGHDAGSILDHEITIAADRFTPVDETLIPTGELRPVVGTAFDFRETRRIGESIGEDDRQLRFAGGYDHNFVLNHPGGPDLALAAKVREPGSGRALEVLTTEPGLQFYSGNFLDETEVGKGGRAYAHRTGFCLETQHFPDSPNHPDFPPVILRPGRIYESTTIYRFTAE